MAEFPDLPRRVFLKNASLILGTSIVFCYHPLAFSLQEFEHTNYLPRFAQLSALLTAQDNLPHALVEIYYHELSQTPDRKNFFLLLKKINASDTKNVKKFIATQLQENTALGQLLKKITFLWYSGSLHDKTVSALSYQQSLMWPMFGSTAPGTPSGKNWQDRPAFLD